MNRREHLKNKHQIKHSSSLRFSFSRDIPREFTLVINSLLSNEISCFYFILLFFISVLEETNDMVESLTFGLFSQPTTEGPKWRPSIPFSQQLSYIIFFYYSHRRLSLWEGMENPFFYLSSRTWIVLLWVRMWGLEPSLSRHLVQWISNVMPRN